MEPIQSLSLEKFSGPYASWPSKTALLQHGQTTGAEVSGYGLEGQYRCKAGYLIITSQDCPHEEANNFILLGADFKILAITQLSAPYHSFLINAHWPISATQLRLHYSPQLFYTLSLHAPKIPLFGRHRIKLKLDKHPERDARSVASIQELQKRLAETRNSLNQL